MGFIWLCAVGLVPQFPASRPPCEQVGEFGWVWRCVEPLTTSPPVDVSIPVDRPLSRFKPRAGGTKYVLPGGQGSEQPPKIPMSTYSTKYQIQCGHLFLIYQMAKLGNHCHHGQPIRGHCIPDLGP